MLKELLGGYVGGEASGRKKIVKEGITVSTFQVGITVSSFSPTQDFLAETKRVRLENVVYQNFFMSHCHIPKRRPLL